MSAAANVPCKDPARAFAFERITAPFLREEDLAPGACSVCGASDVPVDKQGRCAGQLAITQKRHTALDGHALEVGAPHYNGDKQGRFSLADKLMTLFASDRLSFTTAKVVPRRPLSATASIRRGTTFLNVLEMVTKEDYAPYVLVEFAQRASMPMQITQSNDAIVINGPTMPVVLDRRRLRHVLDLLDTHGEKALALASSVRDLAATDRGAAIKARAELKAKHPDLEAVLGGEPSTIPTGRETEFAYAKAIVRSRSKTPAEAAGQAAAA